MSGLPVGFAPGSTFAGVAFAINQRQYAARPLPDVAVEYVKQHVPGGDITIVQILGTQSPDWGIPILVPSGNWDTLKSKVGSQSTLTVLGATPRVATLMSLTGIDDVNLQGFVLCSALWVVS